MAPMTRCERERGEGLIDPPHARSRSLPPLVREEIGEFHTFSRSLTLTRNDAAEARESAPSGDSENLAELAHRVERLMPSHRDPEQFHVEKSEIAHALRRLARTTRQPRRDHNSAGQPRVTGERRKVQCSLD
jgi:hypothetical protein